MCLFLSCVLQGEYVNASCVHDLHQLQWLCDRESLCVKLGNFEVCKVGNFDGVDSPRAGILNVVP